MSRNYSSSREDTDLSRAAFAIYKAETVEASRVMKRATLIIRTTRPEDQFGLEGMRERADLIGAQLEVIAASQLGQTLLILAAWPLRPRPQPHLHLREKFRESWRFAIGTRLEKLS